MCSCMRSCVCVCVLNLVFIVWQESELASNVDEEDDEEDDEDEDEDDDGLFCYIRNEKK